MKTYNFSAGPSALPAPVLEQVQEELRDWRGLGVSVMEVSHRSAEFMALAHQAEQDLRALLQIPENYKVLFLQGGATAQFSLIPLNFLANGGVADYIDTGLWSCKALTEAKRYGRINVVTSSAANGYRDIAEPESWRLTPDAQYVHYCPNETVHGLAFDFIPATADVPLIADMSSMILSAPVDVSRFGLIYAGAQKNMGPAGLTVLILREDLLDRVSAICPRVFNNALVASEGSMLNTPPTFAWYVTALVFSWLKEQGGVEAMARKNREKAQKLYTLIDQEPFYDNAVKPRFRSIMNVVFTLADRALEPVFCAEAQKAGLLYLKGHRAVGGIRASIYNAVSLEAVDCLVAFMQHFSRRFG